MSALVGMLLNGRYRLDAQIGTGGMSTVYRAFDTVLERKVAIKLMHREIAADSGQLERFRREARAVAQLSHPHIVGVIDAGEDEGHPYIVFEHVDGETLKDRIRHRGRLPVEEAIAYAIEIARALRCAHARGIVHRDIKPQNVLIDEEGTAKVTDFGIARTLDEDALTAAGRVLGTTDYVSPEQALGRDVNGQSDIYSLGIVLFEMLTGDIPFHGENQVAVAMKHVREELPDVQALRPEVSATLASVLDHMTSKDLRRRYATAEALEADLEEALALEAARSGHATGEATAVLRTLPDSARRRLPLRVRWPIPLLVLIVVGAIAAAAAALLFKEGAERVQSGTGSPGKTEVPTGTRTVSVKDTSANDYDPLGDGEEHGEKALLVVDRQKDTVWDTETYRGGVLAGKAGVGIYIDAAPKVAAAELRVITPEPGFRVSILGAVNSVPKTVPGGWTELASGTVRSREQRFKLDAGDRAYRYYLVWITDLAEGASEVQIGEIVLYEPS
jgi:serine/threonine-protein kinase